MANHDHKLGITSCVVTAGLLIAWGITAGVVSGSRSANSRRINERDEIIKPILGKQKFAEIKINDAVKAGKIDKVTANALVQASKKGSDTSNKIGGGSLTVVRDVRSLQKK